MPRTLPWLGLMVACGFVGCGRNDAIDPRLPPTIQADPGAAVPDAEVKARGAVFLPVYSHIYIGDSDRPYQLTATIMVRNPDPERGLSVLSARYLDSSGKEIRSFTDGPFRLGPHAAAEFIVGQSDRSGGAGASVRIEWASRDEVLAPIVEAVMIGTSGAQGISFLSVGRPARSRGADVPAP
jgi:hypothetical protein